jgi:hypothetical protein
MWLSAQDLNALTSHENFNYYTGTSYYLLFGIADCCLRKGCFCSNTDSALIHQDYLQQAAGQSTASLNFLSNHFLGVAVLDWQEV